MEEVKGNRPSPPKEKDVEYLNGDPNMVILLRDVA